jgi:rod shape-determining protein MreC
MTRRRIVVGVLVLLSLVLITISFREPTGGPLHQVESAGATVLRPFEIAAERVARPFRDVYGYFAGLVHVKRENERLKDQINELRQNELQAQAALEQNRNLRSMLQFVDGPVFPADYTAVNTRIISFTSEFEQQIVIAAGSDRGIKQDTPIVTNDGLVGRVTDLSGSAAQVTLLTDENSAVPARDASTGAVGLVRHGQGEGSLILDFVNKEMNVQRGDVIVTAGTRSKRYPSLFPANIQIGVVTSVGQSDTALYKQIQIEPFVDFSSLDAVTALITKKSTPQAP